MKSEEVIGLQSATHPTLYERFRVLILGGTGEASQLAARLSERSDLTVISSLAGRVGLPAMPAGMVRIGGFGGALGLIEYLSTEKIDVVIDATHPFATTISIHAELACEQTKIPLIAFERPAWPPQARDRWVQVPDVASAALLVNQRSYRVMLAVGRQALTEFSGCGKAWFLIRAIDEPTVPLPKRSKLILSRGPFHLNEERQLLRQKAITHIVCKNSGGEATYAKIEAARELEIEVIMLERPAVTRTSPCTHLNEVHRRLEELRKGHAALRYESTETKRL